MLDKDSLDRALKPLLRRLGLGTRSFHTEPEVCVRATWQGHVVDLRLLASEPTESLHVAALIATVKTPDWITSVAPALLAANAFGAATGGLALAWSPGDHSLYLGHSLFPAAVSPEALDAVCARVLSGVIHLRRELVARFPDQLVTPRDG